MGNTNDRSDVLSLRRTAAIVGYERLEREETMPKGMAAVAGLILAVSLVLPAAAQTPPADDAIAQQAQHGREGRRQAREVQRAANLFSEAATTYVEIINLCLTNRGGSVRSVLGSARGELTRLRPMLSEEVQKALDDRLAQMEAAEDSGNLTATALAAAESFKTIIMAINPQMRRTPVEVSLHTYAALKLVVLASASTPDWPAMVQTAKDSEKSWIALRRMVRDTNLRVLLSEIQSGLRDSVTRNDAAGVKFAARLQVGSTAVLRDFFERFARSMARGR
jgi:hypothetical protein